MNDMLLHLVEEKPDNEDIRRIETYRVMDGSEVTFDDVSDENGRRKSIRRSNVLIRVIREE